MRFIGCPGPVVPPSVPLGCTGDSLYYLGELPLPDASQAPLVHPVARSSVYDNRQSKLCDNRMRHILVRWEGYVVTRCETGVASNE